MTNSRPYREELFQWIWKELQFDFKNLQTTCGKALRIIDPGILNHGAGPDFLGAHLRVGGNEWHGSVEIHKKPKEWIQHDHHNDQEFNSVVLHVVFEDQGSNYIHTKDGHEPFTLELVNYLTKSIHKLLEAKQKQGIACSGNVSFINQKAFEEQIVKAQIEYLEYKVNELLEYFDPSQVFSIAWKRSLITGIYSTLGIPSNQKEMENLAAIVHKNDKIFEQDFLFFLKSVEKIAFKSENYFEWNFSGMRPASHPDKRVKQAAGLHYAICQLSFPEFFRSNLEDIWERIIANVNPVYRPGQSRLSLIKQLIYIPSIYLLGDLLHSKKVKNSAKEVWSSSVQHVPDEMKVPFKKAGFTINSTTKKIGLAHQYKRYCREKNCHRCEVFKKAIHS